jgi:hypothetical protein
MALLQILINLIILILTIQEYFTVTNYLNDNCKSSEIVHVLKEETGNCRLWYHFDSTIHALTICNKTYMNTFQFKNKNCENNYFGRIQTRINSCQKEDYGSWSEQCPGELLESYSFKAKLYVLNNRNECITNEGLKGVLYYTDKCITSTKGFSMRGRCFKERKQAIIEYFHEPNCLGKTEYQIYNFNQCQQYFPKNFSFIQKYGLVVEEC